MLGPFRKERLTHCGQGHQVPFVGLSSIDDAGYCPALLPKLQQNLAHLLLHLAQLLLHLVHLLLHLALHLLHLPQLLKICCSCWGTPVYPCCSWALIPGTSPRHPA